MGGAYGLGPDDNENIVGIIPRVIQDLYNGVRERSDENDFTIKVSYLEVCYQQTSSERCHIFNDFPLAQMY